MFGSTLGNIYGITYFLLYQLIGIMVASRLLKKESFAFRILLGSVFGSFSLQWFPTIFSFFTGFGITSHILALIFYTLLAVLIFWKVSVTKTIPTAASTAIYDLQYKNLIVFILIPTFLYFCYALINHTIPMHFDGAIYTGQCTYGDMNMHLGFITSIANQGSFPPDYSILPGTKLAYPFLSDSISSSVYVFGASLRIAYILPMLFAILQVFVGMYIFAFHWLKSATKACIAFVLFFFNGGFGFLYFIDFTFQDSKKFTRIFTEFYETPTNLVGQNIRWTNTIVDMLLPQRATLFGWAILFPLIALLYKAIQDKNKKYFILSGILAGGLPMIHTHSFMAFGLICAAWLLYQLIELNTNSKNDKKWGESSQRIGIYAVLTGILTFTALDILNSRNADAPIPAKYLLLLAFLGAIAVFLYLSFLGYRTWKMGKLPHIVQTWGVFFVIIVLLACPQLFIWTFQQVGSGGFVRGYFNWSNEGDPYLWFYLKNIGITAIAVIPALCFCKRKTLGMVAPALLIWFLAELIVFTPNVYDNNKLLYVAYLLFCCLAADFMLNLYQRGKNKMVKKIVGISLLFLCTISAILTMGREAVSEYQLYSSSQVELCKYIEENLPVDATILTDTRHNNAVASLTGRNIVCGAGTFLYFHGLDYTQQEADVATMYQYPVDKKNLYDQYNVSYILIGNDERYKYPELDEESISSLYECVFTFGDVKLYKVK